MSGEVCSASSALTERDVTMVMPDSRENNDREPRKRASVKKEHNPGESAEKAEQLRAVKPVDRHIEKAEVVR